MLWAICLPTRLTTAATDPAEAERAAARARDEVGARRHRAVANRLRLAALQRRLLVLVDGVVDFVGEERNASDAG